MSRLVVIVAILGGLYWYWQGPYQARSNPDYQTQLQQNQKNMEECLRAKAYQIGATGQGSGEALAREQCAEEHNLYFDDGQWHSYGTARPDGK